MTQGDADRAYGINGITNLTTYISKSSESSALLVYQASGTHMILGIYGSHELDF